MHHRFSYCCLLLALSTGCNVFPLAPGVPVREEKEPIPGLPGKHTLRLAPFVFLSDFDLNPQPLFKDLATLRDQVFRELSLPGGTSPVIFVYVFEDRERFEAFMRQKYPDLPRRRAFFVAQPRRIGGAEDLLVYTYWGERIQQDLRHELTHALLHGVLKDVPLWLDEGLAEFFEVPTGWNGVNYLHVDQLLRGPDGPTRLDLERLEVLTKVQHMSPAEYREAWAWVHWMLRGSPQARKELLAYLNELRTNPRPGPLLPRLARVIPAPNVAAETHIVEIDRTRPKGKK